MSSPGPLLTAPVGKVLRDQSLPMAVGLVAMILVNVIDTYWASKLGTDELAAMSFSFPVIGVLINVSIGLMIGTSVSVSQVVGQGKTEVASRLAGHALLLGLAIVFLVSGGGLLSQGWLFPMLGAPAELMPDIEAYMTIWFASAVVLVVPMMANGILRAHGDAKTPRDVMVLAAVANGILDPLLIFGWGPIPEMGLQGAALATAGSRVIGAIYAFRKLSKTGALDLHVPGLSELWESWKTILAVGIPATVTNVLMPVATAMITATVATFGAAAVAAYGTGGRVVALVMIGPMALSSGLSPFIGQNWGAHLPVRVRKGFRVSALFGAAWGGAFMVVMLIGAPWIAKVFTQDPEVIDALVLYLRVGSLSFASYGAMMIVGSTFNALGQATRATILSVLGNLVLAVPLAWGLSRVLGLTGLFGGLVIASWVTLTIGLWWMRTFLSAKGHSDFVGEAQIESHEARFLVETAPEAYQDSMEQLLTGMAALDRVQFRRIRFDAVGFFVGDRQLGHVHTKGTLDLPLPPSIGRILTQEGLVTPHSVRPEEGWFSHQLNEQPTLCRAGWLLRLSHVLAEVELEGLQGEHVLAERPGLRLTPALDAAIDDVGALLAE